MISTDIDKTLIEHMNGESRNFRTIIILLCRPDHLLFPWGGGGEGKGGGGRNTSKVPLDSHPLITVAGWGLKKGRPAPWEGNARVR